MATEYSAEIRRDSRGFVELSWTGFDTADIYVSTVPHVWNDIPLLAAAAGPVVLEDLSPSCRHYFLLRPVDGGRQLELAERVLPLAGGTNFRDFGGYLTVDGRRVRWGRLYRSGHMAMLTEQDQALLAALDIRVNCDLRREEEQQRDPSRLPASVEILSLGIAPGSAGKFHEHVRAGHASPREVVQFMVGINEEFAIDHQGQYARVLDALTAVGDGALLINCSAGKDRTGFGVALILMALGVPRETILADYLLSAEHYPLERELARVLREYGPEAGGELEEDTLRPMMETRAEYLAKALDIVDEQFGGADKYLAEVYGFDRAARGALCEQYTVALVGA